MRNIPKLMDFEVSFPAYGLQRAIASSEPTKSH